MKRAKRSRRVKAIDVGEAKVDTEVPEILEELATLYRDRRETYGPTDQYFGPLLFALFPRGLNITTVDDANRAALLFHCINKMMRYASAFDRGGHSDSLRDLAVYAIMLEDYDAVRRRAK